MTTSYMGDSGYIIFWKKNNEEKYSPLYESKS